MRSVEIGDDQLQAFEGAGVMVVMPVPIWMEQPDPAG